jgi:hypothetical protein
MHGPSTPAHSFRSAPPTLSLTSNAGLRPSRPKRKKAAATHRYHPTPIPLLPELRIPPRLRLRLSILVLLQPAPIKGHRPPVRLPRVLLVLVRALHSRSTLYGAVRGALAGVVGGTSSTENAVTCNYPRPISGKQPRTRVAGEREGMQSKPGVY